MSVYSVGVESIRKRAYHYELFRFLKKQQGIRYSVMNKLRNPACSGVSFALAESERLPSLCSVISREEASKQDEDIRFTHCF